MIGYTTLGVKDLEASKAFYAELFADQGGKVAIDAGRIAFIACNRGEPMLALCTPYDGEAASAGNGTMVAFSSASKEAVDASYAKAIALGATCDGAPGQRIEDRFYGAYVRDADNNKLCFFVFG